MTSCSQSEMRVMKTLLEQLRKVMEQSKPFPESEDEEGDEDEGEGRGGKGKGPGGPEWRKGRAKRRASCPYAKESSCDGK